MRLKKTFLKFRERAIFVAKETNIDLPETFYRYGLYICWKCNREILVFAWPKEGIWDSKDPKIFPPPSTVKKWGSATVGREYWINTCPYCQAVQGDFFLHAEPDGAFFGIDCKNDTPIAYIRDMLEIADYAEYIGMLDNITNQTGDLL